MPVHSVFSEGGLTNSASRKETVSLTISASAERCQIALLAPRELTGNDCHVQWPDESLDPFMGHV